MMAVVCPAGGRERDVAEHRLLGPRVVEADVAELERARAGSSVDRRRPATPTDGVGVEHLLDALGAHRGPGRHDGHERGHHHRHQDLDQVAEEGDQRADLQSPLSMRSAPNQMHGRRSTR